MAALAWYQACITTRLLNLMSGWIVRDGREHCDQIEQHFTPKGPIPLAAFNFQIRCVASRNCQIAAVRRSLAEQSYLTASHLRVTNIKRGSNKMDMQSLKDLMIDELKDLYSAENQILKALPKMIKKATSPALKRGFEKHLKETEGHVERLDKIFRQLDESPRGKKCKGMEGVIADGKELMEEDAEPEVMDAGLIGAAQHVEHYEIAGYGCVRTYAELLGLSAVAKLLQKTLDEEKATDEKLTELARGINVEAEEEAA
jgi:ferritin-like metal-binding protein YciE